MTALGPATIRRWNAGTMMTCEPCPPRVGRRSDPCHPTSIRPFTADDIVAFAPGFELPIGYFFSPPRAYAK